MSKNNQSKSTIPVVLFVFNRYETLSETLSCLKDNNIDLLYVFADGPRNTADKSGVAKVRDVIRDIDWVETRIEYSEKNKGLSESIQFGLDKVFNLHEAAIVIEDDICVAPGFYGYVKRCLSKFESNQSIAGITGLRYPFNRTNIDNCKSDVFLAPRFSSWGWATWSDRWKSFDLDQQNIIHKVESNPDLNIAEGGADLLEAYSIIKAGGLTGCWDVFIYFNMLLENQYFVWPKYNMVHNTGLVDGTHATGEAPVWQSEWEDPTKKNFIIPEVIAPDNLIITDFLQVFEPAKRPVSLKQILQKIRNR